MGHRKRPGAVAEFGNRVERNQRSGRSAHIEHAKGRRLSLVAGLQLEDHPVLVGRSVDGRYLRRAEREVEGALDLLRRNAERGRFLSVDFHVDLRPGDLQVGGSVDDSWKLQQFTLDAWRQLIEL